MNWRSAAQLARALVLAEVAFATGFLIMTMTFTKTAVALRAIDFPFDARRIFVAQLGLTASTLELDRRTRTSCARSHSTARRDAGRRAPARS